MSDLQSKYQILAGEYAKLRAQVPVLKKAVLDEQAVEEQLKEALKEKDQSIRKFEQEVDSLTFRNQQLSTRVQVLQKELDEASQRNKKSKTKNGGAAESNNSHPISNSIIDEELKNKIEENVRLHRKVYESDQDHQAELTRLQKRLEVLESESTQHQSVLDETVATHKKQIHKLQEDKAILEAKLYKQEKQTREAVKNAKELEEKVNSLERELGTRVQEMSEIISHKLVFNDSADSTLNALNVPCLDRQQQLQSRELISQANTLIRDLMNAIHDFYTHSAQRCKLIAADSDSELLTETNNKYCRLLDEGILVLKETRQSFEVFHKSIADGDQIILLETSVPLKEFADKWKAFTSFAQNLLPVLINTFEQESALSSCPGTLVTKNKDLCTSLERLLTCLSSVNDGVVQLVTWGVHNIKHSSSSQHQLFEKLSKALNDFHDSVRELSRCYNAKFSQEHQLPTVTQKLKSADDCILSAVISLVTCTSKIFAFFSGNQLIFTSPYDLMETSRDKPLNPAVSHLHKRAVDYLQLIQRPEPESVPYATALQNRKTVYSFTESKDTLSQQVLKLQEKVNELEAEREHWMLETKLLQLKYQKAVQNNEGSTKDQSTAASKREGSRQLDGDSGILMTEPSAKELEEARDREQLITNHYQARISEVMSKLQLADSKALHFYSECRAIQRRLQISDAEKQRLQDELTLSNKSVAQLKDELQTTTRSYEVQLSMMSEHLAGMNERLTTQKDEIDVLKYELQQQQQANNSGKNKVVKKGRTG